MASRVLVDTGPLYAVMDARDRHHHACVEALHTLPSPLLSCWPVLTEAAWLLRDRPTALRSLLRLVDSGAIQLLEIGTNAVVWISDFLWQYRDLPAQLADASIMYLAMRERIQTVFTLDRRDFSVYRTQDGECLSIVPS